MAEWQRIVLGHDIVGFRAVPAFAKGGWERYGLAREGVLLAQVHPLQTTRWADDAVGAADLAALLGILITAAERRPSHGRQS
ncbi:hypothetical protein [Streptomyces sp. NPDC047046]|uniref:hypothetical protein n=1 Tax=Streptomyces sp. NPDC047046 TaxID=3155378 RepID=UPI0033DE577D